MRRFIKPVLVTIGAASAAFLIANHSTPLNAAPAAKAKTITICEPEEQEPPNTSFVELPELPTIELPNLAELIPCIPLPTAELPNLEDLLTLPEITLPDIHEILGGAFEGIRLPNPLIPPVPQIGFPGFPDCSNEVTGQTVFEPCPNTD